MTQLLSFHSDPTLKAEYVARVKAHAEADEIVKGQYWQNGKGCAVGCTIHSGTHAAYETILGLPEWLARLEDTLFENLPNRKAKLFPGRFLEAIPVGVNLERIKWKFCAFILAENIERALLLKISDELKEQVVSAIRGILVLHEKAVIDGIWDESAARSARSAAWSAESAAWSAGSAARSAAWSARSARSAAWSAESAAWSAAWSAGSAESAESAAWSAGSAAYTRYAEKLIELLKDAK